MFAAKNELFTRPSASLYKITRSLRFRSSASAYLSRTFVSSATWTLSIWCKRGILGAISPLFGDIKFNANDTFTAGSLTTSAVYRDPAAWYHFVITSSNAYVNGVSIGSLTSTILTNPRIGSNITNYFDGYLAEVNFIDGQALAPTAFGTFNSLGVWQPITYGGSYGTNGFRLPFTNNASTTTLGYDFSPNGNNWTTNNISVTAGATYDSMTDVPTLTSATAANYAVLNPLDKASSASVSNGNLRITSASAAAMGVRGSIQIPTSGKWYYEGTVVSTPSGSTPIEFGSATAAASLTGLQETGSYGIYVSSAINYMNNGAASGSLGTLTAGDIIQFAGDCDNSRIWIGKNNAFFDASSGTTGNPSTNTNPTLSVSPALMFPLYLVYNNSLDANFGQRPFTYTPPTGFVALNTFNLLTGTVTTSGTFTGNASADGPFVYLNGIPTAMTINGNAVTFGTNADKLSNGLKVRSSSSSYNTSGSNTYSVSTTGATFKNANAQGNP